MLQRILGGVLVLLGLVAAALGVASATIWRDTDTVVATARPAGDGTFVVTDPGVLGLVGGDVTVSASVPEGQRVTLAVGRDVDVEGWVGNDPYTRVTGLSDWDTLATQAGEPADEDAETNEAPTTGPDPAGSDMWVAEASDEGSATLRWSDRPGRWTLLAAGVGEGAQAPTLELTWPRTVTTPYLWPGVGVGAALVVVGGVLLVIGGRRVRAERADALGHGDDGDDDGPRPAPGAGSPFGAVRADSAAGAGTARPAAGEPVDATADEPTTDEHPTDEPGSGTARDSAGESGTAEVPLAGRLLRRSRRQRIEPADEPVDAGPAAPSTGPEAPAPVAALPVEPVPAVPASATAPAEQASDPAAQEPLTATGAMRLTRREMRAQEEVRRAAEQGGMTRVLRAITGSIPAVRPQQPGAPGDAPAAPRPDTSTPAGRAAAWRATWGFGDARPSTATPPADEDTTDTTDGENR